MLAFGRIAITNNPSWFPPATDRLGIAALLTPERSEGCRRRVAHVGTGRCWRAEAFSQTLEQRVRVTGAGGKDQNRTNEQRTNVAYFVKELESHHREQGTREPTHEA